MRAAILQHGNSRGICAFEAFGIGALVAHRVHPVVLFLGQHLAVDARLAAHISVDGGQLGIEIGELRRSTDCFQHFGRGFGAIEARRTCRLRRAAIRENKN